MLGHEGCTGRAEQGFEAGNLHGGILDPKTMLIAIGRDVDAIERAVRSSIDDAFESCALRGGEPDRPFSGRLPARLPRGLDQKAYVSARRERKNPNP